MMDYSKLDDYLQIKADLEKAREEFKVLENLTNSLISQLKACYSDSGIVLLHRQIDSAEDCDKIIDYEKRNLAKLNARLVHLSLSYDLDLTDPEGIKSDRTKKKLAHTFSKLHVDVISIIEWILEQQGSVKQTHERYSYTVDSEYF